MKVAVLGASGGIGQPLSLLLKTCHLVTELALYDIKGTVGVSADLSHIPTDTHVSGYLPTADGLRKTLTGAGMVVIPAGVPRQPGMTCRADLFNLNAGIVESLAEGVAQYCPNAFVLLITNPVNSTLPILAEVLKKAGVFNPARVLGVTTLDVVRAQTFASGFTNAPTKDITIPVVGGHSNETIIPLFSQAQPSLSIPTDDLHKITARVQRGGEEVVQAKGGFSSATLSMAFAGFRLAQTIMRAVSGEIGLIEPTFLSVIDIPGGADIAVETGSSYFAVPVLFGPQGAVYAHNPLPNVSEYEAGLLREGVPELKRQIQQGVDFVRRNEMVNGPWDKRSNAKEIVYSTTTEMVCSSL